MGLCYRTDKTTLSRARHQEFGYPMTGLFQNNINHKIPKNIKPNQSKPILPRISSSKKIFLFSFTACSRIIFATLLESPSTQ